MFKRGLHANCLKISTILLFLTVFAGSFVYAEQHDDPLTPWILANEVVRDIELRDLPAASTKLETLWARYSTAENFVKLVNSVKNAYWKAGEYSSHFTQCNRIVTEFPDDPLTPRILADEIRGYIKLKDLPAARTKLETLWTRYSTAEDFVQLVNYVKKAYRKAGEHSSYLALSNRIVTEFPDDPLAPGLLAAEVVGYIKLKDLPAASTKLETLWARYSTAEDFVKLVNPVIKAYWNAREYSPYFTQSDRIVTEFPRDPLTPKILVHLVGGYIARKNLPAASSRLETLWTRYSTSGDFAKYVNYILLEYRIAGEYTAAIELRRRFAAAFPGHRDAAFEMLVREINDSIKLVKLGEMDAADESIDELFDKYSQSARFVDTILSICKQFLAMNDSAAALSYINRALLASPDNEKVIWLLKTKAVCYLDMGAKTQADAVVDEIVQNHSTKKEFPTVLNKIADSHRKHGNHIKSIELHQQVLNANPAVNEQLRAHRGIGMSSVWLGDDTMAQAEVDLIAANYKDHHRAGYSVFVIGEEYYFKAQEAIHKGDQEKSSADFNQAITIWQKNIIEIPDPEHQAMAGYFIASAYQYLGDYEKATAYYQIVIHNWSKYGRTKEALLSCGECYCKLYAYDKSLSEDVEAGLESVVDALVVNHPDVNVTKMTRMLGSIKHKKRQWDDAAAYLELYLQQERQKPLSDVYFMLAQSYANSGRHREALNSYLKYLDTTDGRNQQHLVYSQKEIQRLRKHL